MESRPYITTDPGAVRQEHREAYRRLTFVLKRHSAGLSEEGKRLFHHVAFSLYVDAQSIDAITPISEILRSREWPSSR